MENRFKKQLTHYFVLPAAIIIIVGVAGSVIIQGTVIRAVFICFLLLVLLGIIFYLVLNFNKLNRLLCDIKDKSYDGIVTENSGIFGSVYRLILSLYERLKLQEAELQQEKVRRLRTVIDGQDQERNRLSRELHDGIGQSLIAIKLQLENAEIHNYSMMRAGIDSAKNMIDQTIEEVRRVCNALLPAALDEFGIVSTIRTLSFELSTLAGFKVTFENEGSLDRLSKKSQVYLYRIAQEALNNIAKHARAQHVTIRLLRKNSIVTLEVTDNGKGFIFDPVNFAQRNGLQNMRERTNLLQGELTITSKPGMGTTLLVTIPYSTGNGKDQADIG